MSASNGLFLDGETMRALGYRTVDLLVERLADAAGPLAWRSEPAHDVRRRLAGGPEAGRQDFEPLLRRLERDVLGHMTRTDHPRYFASVPGSGTFAGALGDFIASALKVEAGTWLESAGPTQLELEVLEWFKRWTGYPQQAAGILLDGASTAHITAFACAREVRTGGPRDDLVVYLSDHAHVSLVRAARVIGMRPEQVRILPADPWQRMRPELLETALEADRRAGRTPLLVAATAGSTNTGAIDPLVALADVCARYGVWLHVDAAYGGFATLTDRGREWLSGIDRADSIALDPDKGLHQPYDCGCLLVREGARVLADAFAVTPYGASSEAGAGVDFRELGTAMTRTARALKVWLSLNLVGLDAFRAAQDASFDLALLAQRIVEAEPSLQLMSPAQLGIVCFRRRFPGDPSEDVDKRNALLLEAFSQSGRGVLSPTRLRGSYAIRLCAMNPRSTPADVEETMAWFARADPPPVAPARVAAVGGRQPVVADVLPFGRLVDAQTLRRVALLSELTDEQVQAVAATARLVERPPGGVVVRRWDVSREFFVVLEGRARVLRQGLTVGTLDPGDFFGELAALDWSAEHHTPRVATVEAVTALRLLMLPSGTLQFLVRHSSTVADRVRAVAAERLAAASV